MAKKKATSRPAAKTAVRKKWTGHKGAAKSSARKSLKSKGRVSAAKKPASKGRRTARRKRPAPFGGTLRRGARGCLRSQKTP